MMYRKLLTVFLIAITSTRLLAAEPRVVIVSIDGLRPDIALTAQMPNVRSLMKEGSYTFWAYTTPAAITLPSHTSMLTGVTIERHGISGNDDNAAASQSIKVPTIFQFAKKQNISTGLAAGKSKFSVYLVNDSVDHSWIKNASSDQVAGQAVNILRQHQPRLMVVHFPEVDGSGHSKGWGSRDQLAAAERTDTALGMVLDELKRLGLYDQTTIILSADHGGSGKTHGKEDDRSRFIPWIIAGPHVRKNTDLTLFRDLKVNTYDTFATACHVLQIPLPEALDGKIILQAFETTDLMGGKPSTQAATRPSTQPASSALHPLFGHWCALCTQAAQAATRTERGMELIQGGASAPMDSGASVSSFELIAP